MTSQPPAVSVIMRSFNEAWAIGDTIRQLFAQDFSGHIELIVIDSGSTDGSIEIINQAKPAKLIEIPLGTYVPGVVLNQGARVASHEWLVYLNADATPVGNTWLSELLAACLENPKLGAAFSRQIPRPDCRAVFAHDYERCFGPNRESRNWGHFFSMVSCATRRSVLEKHPIREDLQYAEDDEWTRRLGAAGYPIVYAGKSVAMHSHNYSLAQVRKRSRGDALALAMAGNAPVHGKKFFQQVALGVARDFARDLGWCIRHGHISGIPFAGLARLWQRYGAWEGFNLRTPP